MNTVNGGVLYILVNAGNFWCCCRDTKHRANLHCACGWGTGVCVGEGVQILLLRLCRGGAITVVLKVLYSPSIHIFLSGTPPLPPSMLKESVTVCLKTTFLPWRVFQILALLTPPPSPPHCATRRARCRNNNDYEVNSVSPLAVQYGDSSVLERHHVFITFQVKIKNDGGGLRKSKTCFKGEGIGVLFFFTFLVLVAQAMKFSERFTPVI